MLLASLIPIKSDEAVSAESYKVCFEEVTSSVSEDRLMILELKGGWKDICSFLHATIPRVPFPQVEETHVKGSIESKQKRYKYKWLVTYSIPFTLLIYIGYALKKRHYFWCSINFSKPCNKCILNVTQNMIESIINLTFTYMSNIHLHFGIN